MRGFRPTKGDINFNSLGALECKYFAGNRFKIFFLKQVFYFIDYNLVVTAVFKNNACGFCMKVFELVTPCDVTFLSFGICIARYRPPANMLAMNCELDVLRGTRFELPEPFAHALSIDELLAIGIGELEGFAVGASKSVSQWVKAKITRESKGRDNVGRSHKGVRSRIRIVAAREVAIVRRDNCMA